MTDDFIEVGKISGVYGVQGWVRIFSHTDPRDGILQYNPWYLRLNNEWVEIELEEGRSHMGEKSVVAKLAGYDDRDVVREIMDARIAIRKEQLPDLEDEFYWSELIGLTVKTEKGEVLGVIDSMMETGAHDVMILQGNRERLIPYVWDDIILEVSLEDQEMIVDWDPEF